MFSKEIENKIHQLFEDMYKKTGEISDTTFSTSEASERIMNYVSSRLSSDIEGYVVDLYSVFIDSLKKEEFFLDANNLNALYHLNLRDKILTTYRFDIKNLESYQKGIDYKEINKNLFFSWNCSWNICYWWDSKIRTFCSNRNPFCCNYCRSSCSSMLYIFFISESRKNKV